MPELTVGSPGWWLERLEKKLNEKARQDRLGKLDDYYHGRHPLLFASDEFVEVFQDLLKPLAINFVSLVVDAPVERLTIQGFRVGDGTDDDANRIWRDNDMDAWAVAAHRETLAKGECSIIVWAGDDADTPLISIEDPRTVYVEFNPGRIRDRRAALKRWADDTTAYATLYLPGGLYKYEQPLSVDAAAQMSEGRSAGVIQTSTGGWKERRVGGEDWPLPNPTGVVPVIPMVNRPNMLGQGQSEMESVLPIQDALNKLACDMLIASEFAAFPQRYMIGVDTVDAETGEEKFDFRGAIDRILAVSSDKAQMGEFTAADLENYVKAMEAFVQQMASISHTPPHYLLGRSGVIPSGESTTSAESGLVSKVRTHQGEKGPVWSEVVRVARLVTGASQPMAPAPIWADPERRSWSERADAVSKEASMGVPLEFLLPKLGYAPADVQKIMGMRAQQELEMTAAKVDMLKQLVGAGFEPVAAAAVLDVEVPHSGWLPVTLQPPGGPPPPANGEG